MSEKVNNPATDSVGNGWVSKSHVHAFVLIALTLVGFCVCYLLLQPFLPSLAWALALAVLFNPVHNWLELKIKRPGVAAGISVLAIGFIVVVPTTFVGQRLVSETIRAEQAIREQIQNGDWRGTLAAHPRLTRLVTWLEQELDIAGIVKSVGGWATGAGASLVKASVVQVIQFFLTFYFLFFLLRDRRQALKRLQALLPLTTVEMDRLLERISDTVYATIYGTLAVSAVQGFLGGLMFWWLGLQEALVWGVIMGLLSVVPVLGAFVVWIPAAIYLVITGSWIKAIILTVWGSVVVGGIDNVLRPMLVGNRLKLHTLVAFTSVVGGLILFGASGLVLGPVALTVTIVLLEICRERTRKAGN